MNYHVEHHMFPMVPFHALPRLHELIKDDLPPPNPSILDAYREMIPAHSAVAGRELFVAPRVAADGAALSRIRSVDEPSFVRGGVIARAPNRS